MFLLFLLFLHEKMTQFHEYFADVWLNHKLVGGLSQDS